MTGGMWISIDGVEAAGKTTLADALARRMTDVARVAEFSQGPVGRFLADAVKASPHYISGSPGGQSLVFLGEFWERCDLEVVPQVAQGHTVIHDRGYLSKFAYQHAVMGPTLGEAAWTVLLGVFAALPRPDLTVRLTAPIATIEQRLLTLDGSCDGDRLDFIRRADLIFRQPPIEIGDSLLFDTSTTEADVIAERVASHVATP